MSKSTITLSSGIPVTVVVDRATQVQDGWYDVRVRVGTVLGAASVEGDGTACQGATCRGDWLSTELVTIVGALGGRDARLVMGEISALAGQAIRVTA